MRRLADQATRPAQQAANVERAERFLRDYMTLAREGHTFGNGEVASLLRLIEQDPNASLRELVEAPRPRLFGKKAVTPKSPNQRAYMEARGEGFLAMVRECERVSGRKPAFEVIGGGVKLTMFARADDRA